LIATNNKILSHRNFAVFILSHGRPDNVKTYSTLRRCGYTGEIYIVIDDEDSCRDRYKENFGSQVIIFNKKHAAKVTDVGDNFGKRNSVVFARNQNFIIAENLGLNYFLQLDDDYGSFQWAVDNNNKYISSGRGITLLDSIISVMIDFLDVSGAACVAMAQCGDLMGGSKGTLIKKIKQGKFLRKVMNTFLFNVSKPVKFYGRMNDDVNMCAVNGSRGALFVTIPRLMVNQTETQSNAGGLTDMYLEYGTFAKSFYSVMYMPSCTTITVMGHKNKRLHHRIKWNNAVPAIINDKYRKLA